METMRGAQAAWGRWMLAGLREVGVGLPLSVYLRDDTTSHYAVTSHTHPSPAGPCLHAKPSREGRGEAQRREGGFPVSAGALRRGRLRRRDPQLLSWTCQAPRR